MTMKTTEERQFIKDMRDFAKTTKLLLSSNCYNAAYSYQVCFYSGVLGFIEKCFNKNEELCNLFFDNITVNQKIKKSLKEHFNGQLLDEKESEDIYYWYRIGYSISSKEPDKVLDILIKLHEDIAIEVFKQNEIKKNKTSKRLINRHNALKKSTET